MSQILTKFLAAFPNYSRMKCTVAVCQFTATNVKESNLKIVEDLVKDAVTKQAKMVFLPEACDYMATNSGETKALAEPLTGPLMHAYKELAKNEKVWLSVGGFHEAIENEDKIYNSHVLINDKGEIEATYKKIHLFDVSIPEANINLKESDSALGGKEIVSAIRTPAGIMSLSICYDLRFPELSLLQRKNGAQILTYPSAFTHATGKLHWEVLLRARAIETQCYVIAAAQYGKHNEKRVSFGQSLVIDPKGQILAQCPIYEEGHESNPCMAIAEIDINYLEKIRREMPVFNHRRNDLYSLEGLGFKKISIEEDEIFMFADKRIEESTVFCKTQYSYAFTNIRCVVPGHVLISTRRRCRRLQDLSPPEVNDFFLTAVNVQKAIEKIHGADSSTICVQDGQNAGQTVPHVHVHILPRKQNDFENNDEIYERLASHDRDSSAVGIRSYEERSQEASLLKKYFYK